MDEYREVIRRVEREYGIVDMPIHRCYLILEDCRPGEDLEARLVADLIGDESGAVDDGDRVFSSSPDKH